MAADRADQLGGYRVGELRAACAALGVADQRFLGGIAAVRAPEVARPILDTEHLTLVRGPVGGTHDDPFGGLPDPVVAR